MFNHLKHLTEIPVSFELPSKTAQINHVQMCGNRSAEIWRKSKLEGKLFWAGELRKELLLVGMLANLDFKHLALLFERQRTGMERTLHTLNSERSGCEIPLTVIWESSLSLCSVFLFLKWDCYSLPCPKSELNWWMWLCFEVSSTLCVSSAAVCVVGSGLGLSSPLGIWGLAQYRSIPRTWSLPCVALRTILGSPPTSSEGRLAVLLGEWDHVWLDLPGPLRRFKEWVGWCCCCCTEQLG